MSLGVPAIMPSAVKALASPALVGARERAGAGVGVGHGQGGADQLRGQRLAIGDSGLQLGTAACDWGQRLAIGGQRLAEGPSRENALRARAEGLQYPWKDGDKEAFRRSFVGPSAYGPSEGLQGLQFESMVHP